MACESERDPNYVLGRSENEERSVQERARFFNTATRHLLEDAGITAGMKVLDIGSGPGDVTLIAADLVGPMGRVVGVDVNPAVISTARARAQAAHAPQVSFIAGDIRDVAVDDVFDAVVGRFVLMYSADPVVSLRAALRAVRTDGIAAFHEANMGADFVSDPISPMHQELGRWCSETFRRGGVEMAMGTRLPQVFMAAGLEPPHLTMDTVIGAGRECLERYVSAFGTSHLRSYMPGNMASLPRTMSAWIHSTSATWRSCSAKGASSGRFNAWGHGRGLRAMAPKQTASTGSIGGTGPARLTSSAIAILPSLYPKLPYDHEKRMHPSSCSGERQSLPSSAATALCGRLETFSTRRVRIRAS
jgi:SAM-dependent methyltransferase